MSQHICHCMSCLVGRNTVHRIDISIHRYGSIPPSEVRWPHGVRRGGTMAKLVAKRKAAYEAVHPETKTGGRPGNAGGGKVAKNAKFASFAADTTSSQP
jgi:hypothetical protein